MKLSPTKLPYNDPSNINEKGQPKVSEDAWDLLQRINSGEGLYSPDFLGWGNQSPEERNAAIELLRAHKKRVEEEILDASIDYLAYKGPTGPLPDFFKTTEYAELYEPKDMFHWTTKPDSKSDALDMLAAKIDDTCALRMAAISTADVTSANSTYNQAQMDLVIGLVNELKAKINSMNV
jgi:hypothetical protein